MNIIFNARGDKGISNCLDFIHEKEAHWSAGDLSDS